MVAVFVKYKIENLPKSGLIVNSHCHETTAAPEVQIWQGEEIIATENRRNPRRVLRNPGVLAVSYQPRQRK